MHEAGWLAGAWMDDGWMYVGIPSPGLPGWIGWGVGYNAGGSGDSASHAHIRTLLRTLTGCLDLCSFLLLKVEVDGYTHTYVRDGRKRIYARRTRRAKDERETGEKKIEIEIKAFKDYRIIHISKHARKLGPGLNIRQIIGQKVKLFFVWAEGLECFEKIELKDWSICSNDDFEWGLQTQEASPTVPDECTVQSCNVTETKLFPTYSGSARETETKRRLNENSKAKK